MHDRYRHRFTSDFAFTMVNAMAVLRDNLGVDFDFDEWVLMYLAGGEL